MGTTLINIMGGAISLKYTQTHVTSVITSPGRDLPQILASDWSCIPAHIPSNAGFWCKDSLIVVISLICA